jgi:sugar O-acyltransferase (sialic acid O-acetyltransferase NeuD family)
MTDQKIAVYGAGGFAREVAWLLDSFPENIYQVVAFIDDNPDQHGKALNQIPVMSLAEVKTAFPDVKVLAGIGSPQTREKVTQKSRQEGLEFISVVHPNVEISRFVEIGEGVVVCAGNIITTNIKIGNQVQINLDCTIGHDVVLGDYATLAPGVHVSGNVQIGKRAYIGTGANIINGTVDNPLLIGDDAIIGAGACVTRNIPPNVTAVGIPAKPITKSK